MAQSQGAPARKLRYGYGIVDMEMHNSFKSAKELLPYLPERYHRRWLTTGDGFTGPGMDQRGGGNRTDARSHDGDPPATSHGFIAEQLLDAYDVEYVVCTGSAWAIGTNPDPQYAMAVARAYNDWQVNDFLPRDPRYLGAIVVAPQDVAASVEEMDRMGGHPRMVEVIMSAASLLPYGHPYYHPLYAAAERLGLPIATHTTGEGRGNTGIPTPAGYASRYLEYHTNLALNPMAQLVSLVCSGVFVKHPGLRMVLMEGGISWVPPLLWRLDRAWERHREDLPLLDEPPSVYALRHFRFGTQPVEEPSTVSTGQPAQEAVLEMWKLVQAERTVVFSSDYPHWDADDAFHALPPRTPPDLRRRILRENARELFAKKLAALESK